MKITIHVLPVMGFVVAVVLFELSAWLTVRWHEAAVMRKHIKTLQQATASLKAAVGASRPGVQSQVPGVRSSVGNKTKTTN